MLKVDIRDIYLYIMRMKIPFIHKRGETPGAPPARARVWQIDALRGVAMVLMTIFHALVDIRDFFGLADVRYFEPPLMYIGRASAILFIFISGVSCRFSRNNIKRGVIVFLCGMVVTAATFIYVRELYIRFGILHFLGAAMILAGLLERVLKNDKFERIFLWTAAPLSLLIGFVFSRMTTNLPFLFFLGILTPQFISYDFYPIFPWIGIYLVGYAAGKIVVRNREKLSSYRANAPARALGALGKKSLIYYILHQPALFVVFFVVDRLLAH